LPSSVTGYLYLVTLLVIVCLILGLLCFVGAASGVTLTRVNLVALGLAFWIFTVLVNTWPKT
jgi:hypothetical protein